MRFLPIIVMLILVACAIATGPHSTAVVGTDVKREVAASAPTIEEVIIKEYAK